MRREIELIRHSAASPQLQADLLVLALGVAARNFRREVLAALFREVEAMVKGSSIIDDWIAEGEERGRIEEARQVALRVLRARFGELPEGLVARIESADRRWCEELAERAVCVASLAELERG